MWRDAGRPQSGELLDDKITAKKRVQHRINQLNARKERSESESIDRHFKEKAKSRFRAPRCGGSRLEVNGSIVTNHGEVMTTWVHHFVDLGRSRATHPDVLDNLQSDLAFMQAGSLENEDFVLNTPIVVEELEGAIKKLKRRKSSGSDGIIPEHILFGGQNLRLWLINIFNAIS